MQIYLYPTFFDYVIEVNIVQMSQFQFTLKIV